MVIVSNKNYMAPKKKVTKVSEVKAPKVKAPEVQEPVTKGKELTLPENHSLVHGGPVIKGVRHPFGFSVSTETDEVKGHESEYGVGNGVEAHSIAAGQTVYKILY